MRKRLRSGAVNSASHSNTGELLHHTPEGPTLRSSMPYKKIKNVNQKFVVNMDVLTTSLRECQHCRKGPLDLCNICEDVRAEGVCPVLKVRCCHCMEVNIVRPAEHHRTGKRGPSAFDINSCSRLGAIQTGLGHSHYVGLLSTMGLPSLTYFSKLQNSGKRERNGDRSCG